eukprot:GAHX01001661.1.p1 GENE.GAHX01001661.1~~GAHX01001661.1.p1  ORF type:complete len:625 (-),score=128.81 GAHX01001661.1:256-2130(-)
MFSINKPKVHIDKLIKALILEKEIPLNLGDQELKKYGLEVRNKQNLFPGQNEETYQTIFRNAYNRLSYELKKEEEQRKKAASVGAPKRIKYNNYSGEFIGYSKIEDKIDRLIISPIHNRSSLLRYSTSFHNLKENAIKDRSIHNSVLLLGDKGTGKRTLMNYVSKKLKMSIFEFKYPALVDKIKLSEKKGTDIDEAELFNGTRGSLVLITHLTKEDSHFVALLGEKVRESRLSNFFCFIAESKLDIPTNLFNEADLKSSCITLENLQQKEDVYKLMLKVYEALFRDVGCSRLPIKTRKYLKDTIANKMQHFSNNDIYHFMKYCFIQDFHTSPETNQNLILTEEAINTAFYEIEDSCKKDGIMKPLEIPLTNVGGMKATKEELDMSVILYLKNWKRFKGFRGNAGIILCGPPGCGKTMIANSIAFESNASFINCKGPELVNKYLGESERELRKIFETARNNAPCIIFFDEIDSLCPDRSMNSESGAAKRLVNQFLTEIDTLNRTDKPPVFVIGATNRPNDLDKAIIRQGRLGKIIKVELPCKAERLEIIKVCLKNYEIDEEDIDLETLSDDVNMKDWCGADINSLIAQSHMYALKESIEKDPKNTDSSIVIKNKHIEMALMNFKS